MVEFYQREAEAIARKLGRIEEGQKHPRALIFDEDQNLVAQYGIRRSKKVPHNYIPKQIHVSSKIALDIARCHISREEYLQLIKK